MNLVFVSNFLNHHQIPFCEEMLKLCDGFAFVATENGGAQGYQVSTDMPYVVDYRTSREKAERLILNADAVIFGACPDSLISLRMNENKLSFLYSERFLKKGVWRRFIPRTRNNIINRAAKYRDKNFYLLCASAYLSYDLSFFGFPTEKCLKWGYFPQVKEYGDINGLISDKENNSILWVGRFLDWKHPEVAVGVAKRLKQDGYDFSLNIIGDGEMHDFLSQMIEKNGLGGCVHLLGSLEQEKVREYMEKSEIYLFTSNRREGWGAVLNESMNSGCAVVASRAIGSAPFLIKDGENGLTYKSGDLKDLYGKVKHLLDNPSERQKIGEKAYYTLADTWNSKTAAERLIRLISDVTVTGRCDLYADGPCSNADILREN